MTEYEATTVAAGEDEQFGPLLLEKLTVCILFCHKDLFFAAAQHLGASGTAFAEASMGGRTRDHVGMLLRECFCGLARMHPMLEMLWQVCSCV